MIKKFSTISELFDYAAHEAAAITLVGMVKPCDDERCFMFSPSGCHHWLKIPRNGVDDVEYRGQVGCHGKHAEPHSHPLARLRLTKQCMEELPHLMTLSEIIKQKQSALLQLSVANRSTTMRGFGTQHAMYGAAGHQRWREGALPNRQATLSPCFLVNDEGSIVIYCCDENGDNCEPGGIV